MVTGYREPKGFRACHPHQGSPITTSDAGYGGLGCSFPPPPPCPYPLPFPLHPPSLFPLPLPHALTMQQLESVLLVVRDLPQTPCPFPFPYPFFAPHTGLPPSPCDSLKMFFLRSMIFKLPSAVRVPMSPATATQLKRLNGTPFERRRGC